jgi:hypothetical protein
MSPLESRASSRPIVEPLDDWVLVQPTMEEEYVPRADIADALDEAVPAET